MASSPSVCLSISIHPPTCQPIFCLLFLCVCFYFSFFSSLNCVQEASAASQTRYHLTQWRVERWNLMLLLQIFLQDSAFLLVFGELSLLDHLTSLFTFFLLASVRPLLFWQDSFVTENRVSALLGIRHVKKNNFASNWKSAIEGPIHYFLSFYSSL